MVITHHSAECVRISAGDTALAFGPVSKKSKLKATSFGADVAFISFNHPDMNGAEQVERSGKEPFVIQGPGEYEIGSMSAAGFGSVSNYAGNEAINTIYVVHFDGLTVVYLGAQNATELPKQVIEDLDEVDVLFVPVGGGGVLSPADAHKLAVKLEAKIIVPIHWDEVGEKDSLKKFLKEAGEEKLKPVEKLTLKPKDVAGKSGEVVVVSA